MISLDNETGFCLTRQREVIPEEFDFAQPCRANRYVAAYVTFER